MDMNSKMALERLLQIADGSSGQSRVVADFLLAWWNAEECGGFDLTKLWSVDTLIAADMLAVVSLIARVHQYPDTLGYATQFGQLFRAWHTPALT